MSRTMAFVPESDSEPDKPRPAAGGSGPPGKRKALNATMAFGDPNAELQRAAKKMIEEAEQKVAAQKAAAPSAEKAPTPTDTAPAAPPAAPPDKGGLSQTMAFGAVTPDQAKRSPPGRHRTASFGAIPPSEATGPTTNTIPSADETRGASRRRKGLSATIAFGESPAEVEKAVEQARARLATNQTGGQTMAFEAVKEPARTTPVPPGPGQRTTPVPPGPGQRTTPVPPGPGQQAPSTPSPPAAAHRSRARSGLTSTVAFEAPSEIVEAARVTAESKAAQPAAPKPSANLSSTLAFEAPSELAAREAAAEAASEAEDDSDLAKTLAYEPNDEVAKAQKAAAALDQAPRPAVGGPQRKQTMIGGMGALPRGIHSPAPAAGAPPGTPPAGGPAEAPAAGAPGSAAAATSLGLGHAPVHSPAAPPDAPVFDAASAVGAPPGAGGYPPAPTPGAGYPPAPSPDVAWASGGYPAAPGPGMAGGYPAAPQPLAGPAGGYPAAPQGQANMPTLAPPKRNTGVVVGIVVAVIVVLVIAIFALWSFVS